MNQELLQSAITFFKEQHGTYESMKAQMTQGGIGEPEINLIYEEIKRLNLDPSLPTYRKDQAAPVVASVTSTGYKPINPQTPSPVTPTVAQPASVVTPPTQQTPPVTTTPQIPAQPSPAIVQTAAQTATQPKTQEAPPQPTPAPVETKLAAQPATPAAPQIPDYLSKQGMTLPTAPQPVVQTETKTSSKALVVVIMSVVFMFATIIGVIAYSSYKPHSGASLLVESAASLVGMSPDSVKALQSLFPFEQTPETPQAAPIVTPEPSAPTTTTVSEIASSSIAVSAVVEAAPTPSPAVERPIDTDLSDEARLRDQKTVADIQTKCLSRYGNIQSCFDGNIYVVRRIIADYKSIATKSTGEKAVYLGDIANKAISGSDSLSVIFYPDKGASLSGKPSLIDLDLVATPVVCTDKKTSKQITLSANSEEVRLCSPKPETLVNITCGTLSTTIAICSKGIKSYGVYNSNDDIMIKDLLAKYTTALFGSTQ